VAEARKDPNAVTRANAVYLALLEAAGLSAGKGHRSTGDAWDGILADVLRAGPTVGDPAN
jgi:hypothetical protein